MSEQTYLDLLEDVLRGGEDREDRTGVGTRSIFGAQMRFDLREGFPALTTKRLYWHGVVTELLWFLAGETNIKPLQDRKVHIWDAWATDEGHLGPVYGAQWRRVEYHDGYDWLQRDQIAELIKGLRENPTGRRHIVNAWNVGELDVMALPPCHMMFQCYVSNQGELDLQLYQRSADLFLGVPFNIASYALLMHILARLTGLQPRYFIHTIGDAHIYRNHVEQVLTQLERAQRSLPTLQLGVRALAATKIDDFALGRLESDDFKLRGYRPHPTIKAEVAV